jgi:chromosome segregation ATPase
VCLCSELKEQQTQTTSELAAANKLANVLRVQLTSAEDGAHSASATTDETRRRMSELNSLVRQIDGTRERAEQQLKATVLQLTEAKADIAQMHAERQTFEQRLQKAGQDNAQLRQVLQVLDKERDKLQALVDEKSETVAKYAPHIRHTTLRTHHVAPCAIADPIVACVLRAADCAD